MRIRRCGGCKNMVGAESAECPVCGLTKGQVLLRRCVRWTLIVLLIGLAVTMFQGRCAGDPRRLQNPRRNVGRPGAKKHALRNGNHVAQVMGKIKA